jgi:hypothetical protein
MRGSTRYIFLEVAKAEGLTRICTDETDSRTGKSKDETRTFVQDDEEQQRTGKKLWSASGEVCPRRDAGKGLYSETIQRIATPS